MRRLPEKWLKCLKCGRMIFTDKNHRFCAKCKIKNAMLRKHNKVTTVRAVIPESYSDTFDEEE